MEHDQTDDMEDPIALAQQFIAGKNIKRSALIRMVAELLAMIPIDMPPALCAPTGPPIQPTRSPIAIEHGPAGSIFLGPEANRYYTRSEAIALYTAIANATIK